MSKRLAFSGQRIGRGGFTIIELMIATLVFSVVLVLITYGVISFNNAYYKGVVQSNTQNVARTIVENVSQAVQFSATPVSDELSGGGSSGYCVGDQRYSFVLGQQLVKGSPGTDQTNHALVLDTLLGCDGSASPQPLNGPSLTTGSTELLGQNMRLSNFSITPLGNNLYSIDVRVVYGDNDLLCSPSTPNSCNVPTSTNGDTQTDTQCKFNISGSQFCAVSELTTTVQKRIN